MFLLYPNIKHTLKASIFKYDENYYFHKTKLKINKKNGSLNSFPFKIKKKAFTLVLWFQEKTKNTKKKNPNNLFFLYNKKKKTSLNHSCKKFPIELVTLTVHGTHLEFYIFTRKITNKK